MSSPPAPSVVGGARAIPSLDGLRAVSIMLVVMGHLATSEALYPLGMLGVRVFFVISGYLITHLLLEELRATGTIALRRFFLRRILRLLPAAYVFIGVVGLLAMAGWLVLQPYDMPLAMTYTINYYRDRSWYLGHLWSLSVEEQFYLFWPLTLRYSGRATAMKVLAAVVVLSPLYRLASPYLGWAGTEESFPMVADALAIGCLLAGLAPRLGGDPRYQRVLASRWFVLVPVLAVLLSFTPYTKVRWGIATTCVNVAIALTIDWAVRNAAAGRVGRVLNYRPIKFLGVLSYSLYLWQQLFLNRESHSVLAAFPQNLVLAVSAAMLSYALVESPFLRLRTRLESMAWARAGRVVPEILKPSAVIRRVP
jgi:peptidoglycan/LPS O-acetylase OafA/YrhL